MAVVSIGTLKAYFRNGAQPEEQHFVDLIDTMNQINSANAQVGDTDTVDLRKELEIIYADVKIATSGLNALQINPEGLYVPTTEFVSTESVDLAPISGGPDQGKIAANVILDPGSNNAISITPEGLFAESFNVQDSPFIQLTNNAGTIQAKLLSSIARSSIGVLSYTGHGLIGLSTIDSGTGAVAFFNYGNGTLDEIAFPEVSFAAGAANGAYDFAQVYWNSAVGLLSAKNGPLTQNERDQGCLPLFIYTSIDGLNVTGAIYNTKWATWNVDELMRELFNEVGTPKSGLELFAGPGSSLGIRAGKFIGMGINKTAGQSRISKSISAINSATLFMATSADIELTPLTTMTTTFINPTGSTKTAVSNNKWTNLRVYAISDIVSPGELLVVVQYGPTEYTSKELAIAGFSSETFTPNPNISHLYYLGFVTIEKNGLSANASFSSSSKWQDGGASASSGGSSVSGTNLAGVRLNASGVATADVLMFDVSSTTEFIAALNTVGNKVINVVGGGINISGPFAINATIGRVEIYGDAVTFAAGGVLTITDATHIKWYNDVYFTAGQTPFGTNVTGTQYFRNIFILSTGTVTFNSGGNIAQYERKSSNMTATNAVQSYWDNTYSAPLATNSLSQIESFNRMNGSGITMPGSWKMYGMRDFMPSGGTFSKMAVISPTGLGGSGTGIQAVIGKVTSSASGSFTGTIMQISPLYTLNSSGRVDLSFGAPISLLQSEEYFLALLVNKSASGDLLSIVPSSGISGGSYISAGENSSGVSPVIGNAVQFFSGTLTMLPWMRAFV